MENVLMATELVQDYHKEDITPRCTMKIDISKAFDSVQWSFLMNTLSAMGFPHIFIRWIELCVTAPSFSVQVNGELAGYFQSTRGLRQGCALSPYLFVICMNVLSHLIDKAAIDGHIDFHPKCRALKLTHLCFADDLLVFLDGSRFSIEGTLRIFDQFSAVSGLQISIEKSTLYLAGFTPQDQMDITASFPFARGHFPVRYLGLPLLTRQMRKNDYTPLIERIRMQMTSWKTRFLSFAGRLQLLKSVITSIINFWISAYRLPSGCIAEIEKLCSAFLWSGPDLNTSKAKIAWQDVCKTKIEGGLGIKSLADANKTTCLKLIWRLLTGDSLWVKWVRDSHLKQHSFWSVRNSQSGSWMWKKILKYKDIAKTFHQKEVANGENTSFWYDHWSDLGRLFDLTGTRGFIDLGITAQSTMAMARNNIRRRLHRSQTLNDIVASLNNQEITLHSGHDVDLWRVSNDTYSKKFSSKTTWELLRRHNPNKNWSVGTWFKYSTPKFSFITWLALHDRLATGDRMQKWNKDTPTGCKFCNCGLETRNHLFFSCKFASEVWMCLASAVLGNDFSVAWDILVELLHTFDRDNITIFLYRYVFQATIYHIWRERNRRRHGEVHVSAQHLIKTIDRTVRNRLLHIRKSQDHNYEQGLSTWFSYTAVSIPASIP